MQTFLNRYFFPPHVTPQNRVFSPEHFILSGLIILAIILIIRLQMKRNDSAFSQRLLYGLGATMLCLEIFRVSWLTTFYGWDLRNLRFDWCNQVCMVLPWIILFKWKKAYPFIDVLSIIGGSMVLLYPLWVFYDYAGIHIMAVQSMLSHGLMVLIPLTMPFTLENDVEISKSWKPLAGLSVMLTVAFAMSRKLDVNYLLMKGANGIPILQRIPAPWHWMVILPIFIGGILLVWRLLQWYNGVIAKKVGVRNENIGYLQQ
ncbi:MAG: YwaF family protein [Eubacterium aggregans]|uniref:YwaF family protein n=1 Tax=Eubacterium aggregans TaxID=81409 RepID=UPI002B1FE27D|nr:YwaF family protein [Eubacterium aggregans]MEA5074170.1 YwaF family protein [Eubacterium aggregans]